MTPEATEQAAAAAEAPAPAATAAPAGFVPTGPRTALADRAERPSITATPDGPLIVRGDVEIVTPDGTPVPRDRRTVALCRCGTSTIAPWCDGSHKITGFRTER